MSNTFIHCGSSKFEPNKFVPVFNHKIMNKPFGGFWACDSTTNDWEEFVEKSFDNNKFLFKISDNARVLLIDSVNVVDDLLSKYYVKASEDHRIIRGMNYFIDWEAISQEYDAIYFKNNKSYYNKVFYLDVDSICITNPAIIIPL